MILQRTLESGELTSGRSYEVKSKLAGQDAINDIPEYLRKGMKRQFGIYETSYPIDNLMGISLVLDYSELVSSSAYSGKVILGRNVPTGQINIRYRCKKAAGNLANWSSRIYIAPRYPRKQELINLVTHLRQVCEGWDFELLSEISDERTSNFILKKFSKDKHLTVKDLQPKFARMIENALNQLYARLDAATASEVKKFHSGRNFGFYEIEPM